MDNFGNYQATCMIQNPYDAARFVVDIKNHISDLHNDLPKVDHLEN